MSFFFYFSNSADRGFYELLELLIENKARVCFNEYRKLRTTSSIADEPLSLALKRNHLNCARLLLENGADPNTRYFMGHEINLINILRTNAIELLLKHKADANARDRTGLTPLMVAARHPQGYKTVELLIDYGADVNAYASERHDYRTVLHHSIFSGNLELIRLLLKSGANYPDMEPVDKPSPLDIAIISGRHDIVRLLTDFNADVNSCSHTTIGQPLHTALTQRVENKYEIVKILLDAGADVNAMQTSNRHTGPPLHDYLHSSRLNANSSQSYQNNNNNNNNHNQQVTMRGPDPKMVRLLLMYGARVELREFASPIMSTSISINHNDNQNINIQEYSGSRFGLARLLERVQDELSLDLVHLLIEAAEVIEWEPMSRIIYNCLRIANRPYANELFDPSVGNDMTSSKLKCLLKKEAFAKRNAAFKVELVKLMQGDEPKWAVFSLKQLCRIKIRHHLLKQVVKRCDPNKMNNNDDDDFNKDNDNCISKNDYTSGDINVASVGKGAILIRRMGDLPIPFILKKYLFYQD